MSNGNGHDKWARNLLSGILVVLVSLGIPGLYRLGALTENVGQLNSQMIKATLQIEELINNDLQDLSQRMIRMEQFRILPEADERIGELEAEIRELKMELRRRDES